MKKILELAQNLGAVIYRQFIELKANFSIACAL